MEARGEDCDVVAGSGPTRPTPPPAPDFLPIRNSVVCSFICVDTRVTLYMDDEIEQLSQAVRVCDANGSRLVLELLDLSGKFKACSVPFALSSAKYQTLYDLCGKDALVSGTGSLLCIAMVMDQWRTVDWLLRPGVNPNGTLEGHGSDGTRVATTALHICLRSGIAQALDTVAPELVRMGADVHAKDNLGVTPMDLLRKLGAAPSDSSIRGNAYTTLATLFDLAT